MSSENFPQVLNERHDAFMENVLDILHVTVAATQELGRYPELLALHKAVEKANHARGKSESSTSTKSLEHFLPFVQKEKARDFALLQGMATIALWSALEAFVDDYLIALLELFPLLARNQAIGQIKIAIGEYEKMTDLDRRQFIVESLKSETAASLKPGVGRFESVLDRFDLGGAVGNELRSCLLEFSNVRNVIVHRNGIADKRLITQCAWLELMPGSPVNVNRRMLNAYAAAAISYSANVHRRVLVKHECNIEAMDVLMTKLESSAVRTTVINHDGEKSE